MRWRARRSQRSAKSSGCWSRCTARSTRRARGAARSISTPPEAEFVIDAGEHVRAIELRKRNEAHRLIEECMILANVAVARELEQRARRRRLYRVHGKPEEQKLETPHRDARLARNRRASAGERHDAGPAGASRGGSVRAPSDPSSSR